MEIVYEAEFEDGDSEIFALEIPPQLLNDHKRLREACLNDLADRWSPTYDDWPEGDVVRLWVTTPTLGCIEL